MTKLFLTGATGYIGGHILYRLVETHPELEISILVRNEKAGDIVQEAYPNAKLKIIIGSFVDGEVIENAAEASDIVIHTNSDSIPATTAMIKGLNKRSEPSFLIHTSGTGIMADMTPENYGEYPNLVPYSDVKDIVDITSRPDDAMHRDVDKIVLAAQAESNDKVKTVIVCPPDIYGVGKGTHNKQSYMIPLYVEFVMRKGVKPFVTGRGNNEKSLSHIDETAEVYIKLVEEAIKGGGKATWGAEGYYFTATSKIRQRDLITGMVKIAESKKWLREDIEIETRDVAASLELSGGARWGPYMWGSNALTQADRAAEQFGFTAFAPSVLDVLKEDVEYAYDQSRTEVMIARTKLDANPTT